MAKTQGLTHLHLGVRDIQRSLAFYQAALGMKVSFWEGPTMVFLNTPGSGDLVTLRQAGDDELVGPGGGFGHFGFGLASKDDLDTAVRDVVEAGGELVERGEHGPGHPFAYVRDPDGYVIEL